MKLILFLRPKSLTFTKQLDGGPYPLLTKVGTLRIAMRAGIQSGLGVGESPFIHVFLDNSERRAATLLGNPLRVRAELWDSPTSLFFTGFVSSADFGSEIDLVIET